MFTKLSMLLFTLFWLAGDVKPEADQNACSFYYSKALKKNVYTLVEEIPEFPGGEAHFQRFLNRNLRYPLEQIDNGEWQSHVTMKFIVDTDGQIKNPTVQDKDSTGDLSPFEKEALRIINLMPKWVPGKCQEKAVAATVKRSMVVCPGRE